MNIKSKLHHVRDFIDEDFRGTSDIKTLSVEVIKDAKIGGSISIDRVMLRNFIEGCAIIPNFHLDQSVLEHTSASDIDSCISAMKTAGILNLPFPAQLVEFSDTYTAYARHIMALFVERKSARLPGEKEDNPFTCIMWFVSRKDGRDSLVVSPSIIHMSFGDNALAADGTKGFGLHYCCEPAPYFKVSKGSPDVMKSISDTSEDYARMCGRALAVLILLLNTKGIRKEVLMPPEKLNKARRKSGKSAILPTTILHIGTIYDRSGRVQWQEGCGARKPARVHWRKGHLRTQRFGAGLQQSKQIFVQPCIVNWTGDEDAPIEPYRADVRW